MASLAVNAGMLKAQISLPSAKLASGDISNAITICTFRFYTESLGCETTMVLIRDGSNNSAEVDVSFRSANSSTGRYEIITQCLSNCAGFGAEQQYYQRDGSFKPGQSLTFESHFPPRLDIVIPEIFEVSMMLPDTRLADGDIINSLQVCEQGSPCSLEFVTIEDGTGSGSAQFTALHGVRYSLIANCLLNCDGYLSDTERWFQADGTWSFNSTAFAFESVANPVELTLLETLDINGRIRLPNAEMATVGITSTVTVCSYDSAGGPMGCTDQSVVLETATNEVSFNSANVIYAGGGGEYSVSTQCVTQCMAFLRAQRSMKPDGSFVFSTTSRVPAPSLTSSIEIELERGESLPVKITTFGQRNAESDENMLVMVCSYDDSSRGLGCVQQTATLLQGTSSIEFDVSGIIPVDDGGSYEVLHKITRHSHDYQRYFEDDGTSTPFLKYDWDNRERPRIAKHNLPVTLEVELWEQSIISEQSQYLNCRGGHLCRVIHVGTL